MQTNYVMKYVNDYNENAKIIKNKFVFEVYFWNLLFSWKIRIISDIHYSMHIHVLKVIIFYFNDIYTNYVIESLNNLI